MPSSLVKLFGTEEPPAETRVLAAGPLTVELDAGNLRYVRYDGHEAIRAVSYVVRDRYWGTFNARIDNFAVEQSGDGFVVTYDAVCRDETQEFRYAGRITGAPDGTLLFEGKGTAVTDFPTNRTGFVVLHPIAGVSGFPVEVLHVDGRTVETAFPELIDPKQPIMDIRALTHEVCPGLRCTCTMEGDAFEMEDQRNWTDASYKTYVRPLGLPFPYTLAAGREITQSVKVSFKGRPAAGPAAGGGAVTVTVGPPDGRVPDFAMALDPQYADAALARADSLAALAPRFVSGYLDTRRVQAEPAIRGFKAVAGMLGVDLALEVVVPADTDPKDVLTYVAEAAQAAAAPVAAVAVTSTDDLDFVMPGTVFADTRGFDALYEAARSTFPGARIGGGNFAYFTELNRKRPPFEALDFVCHTTCAIVHAADDRSVTETIESLPYIIRSGRALFGDKEYRVGPGAMATRTSPFGSDPTPNPHNGRLTMTRWDPRQRGLLGAAWHLGYAARMAERGVDTVILGAPVGEFGLVHHATDFEQPWFDEAGGLYPVYHVMRGVYAASGAQRFATEVSRPREIQALAYRTDEGARLWLANLTGEECALEVAGIDVSGARAAVLDEASFEACAAGVEGFEGTDRALGANRVALGPYTVMRIRYES